MAALGGGCRFEKSSDIVGVAAQLRLLSFLCFARERSEEETAGKEKARASGRRRERERERKTGGGTRRRATKEGGKEKGKGR